MTSFCTPNMAHDIHQTCSMMEWTEVVSQLSPEGGGCRDSMLAWQSRVRVQFPGCPRCLWAGHLHLKMKRAHCILGKKDTSAKLSQQAPEGS